MPTFTARDVRAWAAANDYACSPTGRVPQHVIDAYLVDVHGTTTDPGDQAQQPLEEEGPATWEVRVTIPGLVDPDVVDAISSHILEAIWSAYHAGRTAERADILTSLQEA